MTEKAEPFAELRERAERLAMTFHEAYERLAPQFGYNSRFAGKDWKQVPENNRRLMIAVCKEVAETAAQPTPAQKAEAARRIADEAQRLWDKEDEGGPIPQRWIERILDEVFS